MSPGVSPVRVPMPPAESRSPIMKTKVALLALAAALTLPLAAQTTNVPVATPIAPGRFKPTAESLAKYQCPEWFRDAKFGIWAHWGPQAVPLDGDWYARGMYEPGNGHYKHHLENYGHPSTNGYKDIIPLWKAEKWDPDRLMALYKKAGARYFVSMGSHHDNFFLWNSKIHRWNAAQMGPRRDVVADWQKAAQKQGLKFGVSEHLGASFTWFQSSHGADKTGPLAGVPYDGADPQYQDLYHFPANPGDKDWYSKDPRWQQIWYNSIKELVDNYQLDLLYTDGGVPFGNEVGLSMIAHLYNTDLKNHARQRVVYACKQESKGMWIEDLERGVMPKINPNPWQTDTSIGDWYYNRNWKFRSVSWSIHMLVDIVSKNGNLLLNVVQRPDGSIDPEVEQTLEQMAKWISIHGEAIYGTRPWLVYGEGKVKTKGGSFKEDFKYSANDIRFTTKGKNLYAFALGWPADNQLVIRSLAQPAGTNGNRIKSISLLGSKAKITWTQSPTGLVVKLPAQPVSEYTAALKIKGEDLKPVVVEEAVQPIKPDAQGQLKLAPEEAEMHGTGVNTEERDGQSNIGFWDNAAEWVSWKARVNQPGKYRVLATAAALQEGARLNLVIAGKAVTGSVPSTADWGKFQTFELGDIEIDQAGPVDILARPQDASHWHPINLRSLVLTPR